MPRRLLQDSLAAAFLICSLSAWSEPTPDTIDVNGAVNPIPRLGNISTRINVGTNDDVLVGGFIVIGPTAKQVIVRAIGPSLTAQGVAGSMQDPTLQLIPEHGPSFFNDNWRSDTAAVQASGVPPADDREAAIVQTLAPGSYTAVVRGKNNATGVALVEVYDLTPNSPDFFANISSRGLVGTDTNVMIGGLTVRGTPGSKDMRILVRGLGPSLAARGVGGALQDPELFLVNGDGQVIASNDNWKDTQQTEISNIGLAPSDSHECAIVATLPKGEYTAILRGRNRTTGIALIEVYDAQF